MQEPSPQPAAAGDKTQTGVPGRDQRCCIGLAYFSQALHERSQGPVSILQGAGASIWRLLMCDVWLCMPVLTRTDWAQVCAGLKRKAKHVAEEGNDMVPGGDFKVGHIVCTSLALLMHFHCS